MNFKSSARFLIFFCCCSQATIGQDKLLSYNYTKRFKSELSFSYTPTYNFGRLVLETGDYHPVKFEHPFIHCVEFGAGFQVKHLAISIYYKPVKSRFMLTLTESPDSITSSMYVKKLTEDDFAISNFGFRVGRIGTLTKRLQYIATLGFTANYYPKSNFQYTTVAFALTGVDTLNHVESYTQRIAVNDEMLLTKHFLYNIEAQIKIRCSLTSFLFLHSTLGYVDNPIRILLKESNIYSLKYSINSLDGTGNVISTGHAYTRFNQIHFGLGLDLQI